MQRDYLKIITSYSNYYAMIEHPNKYNDKVHIGNKKRCIVISVYLEEDNENPNIDAIGYDENCNESLDMVENTGTIHMIKAAMAFINKIYGFTEFQFKDKSTIRCKQGYWMPLNIYYMAKHGKTWYESKLKAKALDKQYYKDKKFFKEALHKEELGESHYDELMQNVKPAKKKALYAYYKESKNMKEFLSNFWDHDCYIFRNWLDAYVKKYIKNIIGLEWKMSHDPEFSVTIEKMKERPKDLFMMGGTIAGYFLL
jgi:hypothetical protein